MHALVLLLAAAPRVWAAFADQGLFWPDEFYQSIEQSHRFAFGYGIVPWEFATGARSWVYPGFIGLLWKLLAALGVARSAVLIPAAKLLVVAIAVSGVEAAMRLGQKMSGARAAVLAGVFVAMFPALVLFGSKCMTEPVSAPLILWATWLVYGAASRRAVVTAGVLACLAIFVRYQNGMFAVGLFLLILSERRWRDALVYAASGAIVGLVAGGLLDFVTWGKPFQSFLQYARFHAENRSAPWGSSPFTYYFEYTWRSAGPVMIVVLVGLAFVTRRAWRHVLLVAAYWLMHSYVPHKEYRYVTPIVPLALVLAAAGSIMLADAIAQRTQRVAIARFAMPVLVVVALVGFGERAVRMTFADLGHGDGLAAGLAYGNDSPWHAAEGINRMLWRAGEATDVCGVVIKDIPWSSTGGFAYLHKDVPLFFRYSKRNLQSANYLIARREFQQPAEYQMGPESEGFMLFRRDGICTPAPADYTRTVPP